MAGVALLPIPAEVPAAMNGMLFGRFVGVVITWSGAMIGAQLSFELARRLGRPLVRRFVPERAIEEVDGLVRAAAWPGLIVVRLIPAVAFTALNWGLGLTACRRWTFFWTTALGILPFTIVFVWSGEGVAQLYRRNQGLAIAISLATLALLIAIAWYRRRARLASDRKRSTESSDPNLEG
jgi:uncharacterized membrane protein YdjX (TVP38/TMEM64 family)